jgi:hypothetical protein
MSLLFELLVSFYSFGFFFIFYFFLKKIILVCGSSPPFTASVVPQPVLAIFSYIARHTPPRLFPRFSNPPSPFTGEVHCLLQPPLRSSHNTSRSQSSCSLIHA